MECVNCHFENMPGIDYCGRCGTSLRLADATVDVHPPRAGRTRRWFRAVVPWQQFRRQVRSTWFPRPSRFWASREVLYLGDMLRMIVPGWPQWHAGRRRWGWIYFAAFTVLLLTGLLGFGTTLGSMALGLAFGVHASSVFDAAAMSWRTGGARMALLRAAVVSTILAVVLYMPIGYAISRVYDSVSITSDAPPLLTGDVLLMHHLRRPQVGDVVVYEVNPQQIETGPHAYAYIAGRQIDRILAGPGSRVRIAHGMVFVNGVRSSVTPLGQGVPPLLEVDVPSGSFCILPATTPYMLRPNVQAQIWAKVAVVPEEQISGIVYFRSHPFSRWGRLTQEGGR